jgi:hypothetical protein
MRAGWIGVLASLLCFSAVADSGADYALIQDLVGRYPLLDFNRESRVAGTLTIRADANGVGYTTQALAKASFPVTEVTRVTPQGSTTLERKGDLLIQTFQQDGHSQRIEYTKNEGYVSLVTFQCDPSGCHSEEMTASTGGAPYPAIDFKKYLSALLPSYPVVKAGGVEPARPETADLILNDDPTLAALYFPYCQPTGVCDAGEQDFPYASTHAYQVKLSSTHTVTHFLVSQSGRLRHYSWERDTATNIFRNFQYPIAENVICLEHELKN